MYFQRFFNNLANGLARVERSERILEDHLHFLTLVAHLGFAQLGNIFAFHKDAAFCRFQKTQNNTSGGGFPTSRFPDHTERFAPVDGKGDIIYCVENAFRSFEVFFYMICFQQYI